MGYQILNFVHVCECRATRLRKNRTRQEISFQQVSAHYPFLLYIFSYMKSRGNSKRHTMANPEEIHMLQSTSSATVSGTSLSSGSGGGGGTGRTRRTGLLTVIERPPGKQHLIITALYYCFIACFVKYIVDFIRFIFVVVFLLFY